MSSIVTPCSKLNKKAEMTFPKVLKGTSDSSFSPAPDFLSTFFSVLRSIYLILQPLHSYSPFLAVSHPQAGFSGEMMFNLEHIPCSLSSTVLV